MYSHCTVCKAALRPGDFDPERQFVSCSSCGSMITFRKSTEELRRADGEAVDSLPGKHWAYERKGDVLRLSRRWYSPGVKGLAVVFCGVLAATLSLAFGWLTPWVAGIAFLLFGYPALLGLLNRTHIEASPGIGIRISHGPLPWFFLPRTLRIRDIQQLYGQRRHEKNGDTYELRVQRPDGSTHPLLGAGLTAAEVMFLERTLENRLGIVDQAVPGEFKPEGSA